MTNKIMDTITGITRMASYRKTKIIISLCFVSVQSKSVKYRLMNIIGELAIIIVKEKIKVQ